MLIEIDFNSDEAIYVQLQNQIIMGIAMDMIREGEDVYKRQHFAVGDTCYSWSEDIKVYNPNGKEIVARDNSVSLKRKEDVSKAYFHCHTDITIPYEELGKIAVITKDGTEILLLENGKFVLPGTEILNEPLKNTYK